jgi:hypothetical protein
MHRLDNTVVDIHTDSVEVANEVEYIEYFDWLHNAVVEGELLFFNLGE